MRANQKFSIFSEVMCNNMATQTKQCKKRKTNMSGYLKNRLVKITAFLTLISVQSATALEIESDFDYLISPKTTITGLHRLFVGIPVGETLSFGQSIYSGAAGDGGGAFFWGFEGVKRLPITPRWNVAFSGFLGGGGGASQVVGDGTMSRVGVTGEYALTSNWSARAGVSHISISGAPINDWSSSFGLRYLITPDPKSNDIDGLKLARISIRTSRFQFANALSRSGTSQSELGLLGAEASFDISNNYETFLGADGAISGGDGYMQVIGGLRKRWPLEPVSFLGQTSVGFGGGGNVDTGSGLILGASLGMAFPISDSFDLDLTYGTLNASSSGISGKGTQLSLSRVFDRDRSGKDREEEQQWQVGLGISIQPPNASYMKSRSNVGIQPVMQESSIDYFISTKMYLTGNAQTTISGGVAGYAVGLLGLGHEIVLGEVWRMSLEGHIGAAGGGGVDVGKGLLGGARIEADYILNSNNSVSLGLGVLKSFDGGMNVPIVQLGFKHRFKTH